jgi:carboxymethylenebutenolidase
MHNTPTNIRLGTTSAYYSASKNTGKRAGLIVIEEIWGLNGHIKSVADRFSHEGFTILAPELLPADLLTMLTPQMQKDFFDPDKRDAVQPQLRAAMQPIAQPDYAQSTISTLKTCVATCLQRRTVAGAWE